MADTSINDAVRNDRGLTPLQERYKAAADDIRNKHQRMKHEAESDETRNDEYRSKVISDSKSEASEKMRTLKKEYMAEKEQEHRKIKEKAFECVGLQSEYLKTMAACDSSSNEDRLKLAKNAIMIEANDHVRAAAHSAYNNGDKRTIEYILENAPETITEPLMKLHDYESDQFGYKKRVEREFRLMAFSM